MPSAARACPRFRELDPAHGRRGPLHTPRRRGERTGHTRLDGAVIARLGIRLYLRPGQAQAPRWGPLMTSRRSACRTRLLPRCCPSRLIWRVISVCVRSTTRRSRPAHQLVECGQPQPRLCLLVRANRVVASPRPKLPTACRFGHVPPGSTRGGLAAGSRPRCRPCCAAGTPAVAARQVNPLMPAATSRMRAIVCLQLSPRIRHPPLL